VGELHLPHLAVGARVQSHLDAGDGGDAQRPEIDADDIVVRGLGDVVRPETG
jgi:hypothetical protein